MAVPLGLGSAAGQRLLPERIPFRFFGTAVVAHVLAWLGIVVTADEFVGFAGGAGPVLATLHLLTVGVLLMTAIGASLQMLPVTLARPAPPPWACNVVFALLLAGGGLTIAGFALTDGLVIAAGAAVAAAATTLAIVTIARLVGAAAEPPGLLLHVRGALVCLAAAVAIAVAVAGSYHVKILADPWRWAMAHATLATFGFMGLSALGFATVLMPMFALAEPPAAARIRASFWTVSGALALATAGILFANRWLVGIAIVAALVGVALHLAAMAGSLRTRMRRRLGLEFVLICAAWVAMPVALLLGIGVAFGIAPARLPMLFIVATLFGWLLTLLLGVLQRILPFLASMHSARAGGRMAAPAKLTHERALRVHRWCHAAAVGGLAAGLALDAPVVVRAAAVIGAAGASAFAWFAATVLVRTRAFLRQGPAASRPTKR